MNGKSLSTAFIKATLFTFLTAAILSLAATAEAGPFGPPSILLNEYVNHHKALRIVLNDDGTISFFGTHYHNENSWKLDAKPFWTGPVEEIWISPKYKPKVSRSWPADIPIKPQNTDDVGAYAIFVSGGMIHAVRCFGHSIVSIPRPAGKIEDISYEVVADGYKKEDRWNFISVKTDQTAITYVASDGGSDYNQIAKWNDKFERRPARYAILDPISPFFFATAQYENPYKSALDRLFSRQKFVSVDEYKSKWGDKRAALLSLPSEEAVLERERQIGLVYEKLDYTGIEARWADETKKFAVRAGLSKKDVKALGGDLESTPESIKSKAAPALKFPTSHPINSTSLTAQNSQYAVFGERDKAQVKIRGTGELVREISFPGETLKSVHFVGRNSLVFETDRRKAIYNPTTLRYQFSQGLGLRDKFSEAAVGGTCKSLFEGN